MELEIDGAGKDGYNAEKILDAANNGDERIYIKTDGSLDDGMEIVTHPMSLDYHMNEMPWSEISEIALDMRYRSHNTGTCGLHVHVNRTTFGEERETQDECISRILYFVEHHWEELLKFSRRTESQMNRWAARYGYKNSPKEVMENVKKHSIGRYACVNITNYHTIEFRIPWYLNPQPFNIKGGKKKHKHKKRGKHNEKKHKKQGKHSKAGVSESKSCHYEWWQQLLVDTVPDTVKYIVAGNNPKNDNRVIEMVDNGDGSYSPKKSRR